MRQKLFTLVAVVSAVLCAGLLVLWARSYWTAGVVVISGREMHRLSSGGAGVFVESLGLSIRRGDWRVSKGQVSPSGMRSEYAETREDYAHWRLATFGAAPGWERKIDRYQSRVRLLARQGSPEVNPLLPRVVPVTYRIGGSYKKSNYVAGGRGVVGRGGWVPDWVIGAGAGGLPGARLPGAVGWVW